MWHDILAKLNEDWNRSSSKIRVCLNNLDSCNIDITDERDFSYTLLRWALST
jgi:hypothetical protein